MTEPYKGLFVVFEGGEGSGKTTQAKRMAKALEEDGVPHLLTHEPGGSALGYKLREILLDPDRDPISKKAEALLFAADRAEHVEKVILPALHEGRVVVCDRYIASTMAYQAYAGGLPTNTVQDFSNWASGNLYPDVTFLLDIEPVHGLQRAAMRGKTNRIDERSITYHELVRKGFLRQVDDSWVTLDARDTILELHVDAMIRVHMRLEEKANRISSEQSTAEVDKLLGHYCPVCSSRLLVVLELNRYTCPNGHGFMQFTRVTNASPRS